MKAEAKEQHNETRRPASPHLSAADCGLSGGRAEDPRQLVA